MNTFDKHLIRFLIVSVCYLELPIRSAHSEMASSYSITGAGQSESVRHGLEQYFDREDVRAGLEQIGVNPAAASARVDALSDEEVASIASRIEALPAGGEIIGTMVFVFVLLMVTDILGFTKVYSFTRSVRQ